MIPHDALKLAPLYRVTDDDGNTFLASTKLEGGTRMAVLQNTSDSCIDHGAPRAWLVVLPAGAKLEVDGGKGVAFRDDPRDVDPADGDGRASTVEGQHP